MRYLGGVLIVAGVSACACSVVLWLFGRMGDSLSDFTATAGISAIVTGFVIYGFSGPECKRESLGYRCKGKDCEGCRIVGKGK